MSSPVLADRVKLQASISVCRRPHDDIAALKRLLREVFTNQMQMERRISAIEPHEDDQPSFDSLERSRNGWASLSAPCKSKVELSGNVVMGSALLYSKASQDMSCILSCIVQHTVPLQQDECARCSPVYNTEMCKLLRECTNQGTALC